MIVAYRSVLALLPALLLGAYAARPEAAFLPWIALVPWVLLYTDDRRGPAPVAYYLVGAYVAWLLQYTQAFQFGWYAPFVMGAACIVWWIPFAPLLSRLHHRLGLPRSIATALAWTTTEWIRSTFTVSHFDLYGIGYSQARFPVLVQIADVTGVYGVSFLLAATAGWIVDVLAARRDSGWAGAFRHRRVAVGGVAILTAVVAFSGYGFWRLSSITHVPGPRLAMVQPNVPHTQQNMVGVHLEQLLMTERRVPAGEVDLIVWPENAILDNIRRPGAYLEDLAWMAREKDAWFLVGALGKPADRPGYTTNGAWLIDRDGEIRGHYDKQVLFPWSEYIPGDAFLGRWAPPVQRFHRELTRMGWGFQPTGVPGDATDVLEFPWNGETLRFAALICVENTFPPLPAEAGALGADFFLNITSEGKVGGPVQEQLLRIAMFRAIENRMSYVRVGNTGISGVIDSLGLARAILVGENGNTINTRGVLLVEVPLSHSPRTLYARSGDGFVKLVLAVTALLFVLSFFRRGSGGAAAAVTIVAIALLAGCSSPPSLGTDARAVDTNLRDGRALLDAGRRGEAIEAFAAACAGEEGCALALPRLFEAYDSGKADDDAILLFARIVERYPSLAPDALAFRAVFRERTLDLPGARDDYLRSLELRPAARVHGRLGNLYMRMERFEDALEHFRAGLELTPGDTQLRYVLGRALRIVGRLDESETVLLDLVRDAPSHGNAWTNLGRIQLARGLREEAAQSFRAAVRVEPGIIEARFLLARLALQDGDLDTMETLIREIRAVEAGLGPGPRRE